MKRLILLFLLVMAFITINAQSPESIQKTAMKKIDWLTGTWKGTAITIMGPGKSDTISMHEVLAYHLDSTIITVEGKGYHIVNGKILPVIYHHAFAILSCDNSGNYQWKAWRIPGGIYTEYSPAINEKSFDWSMKTPRGTMRYHIELNTKNKWHETGEFSKDGSNWYPFFEMILSKIE